MIVTMTFISPICWQQAQGKSIARERVEEIKIGLAKQTHRGASRPDRDKQTDGWREAETQTARQRNKRRDSHTSSKTDSQIDTRQRVTEREREKDRQTDRQIDRRSDRQADRQ